MPLLRGLGIDAEWRTIAADTSFFRVTKLLHNALQGAPAALNAEERETYLTCNRRNAMLLEPFYDFVFVHDPQPAAVRHFAPSLGKHWIWRCHIDTSTPNTNAWELLRPYVQEYDAAVFTMPQFVPPDLALREIAIAPPAIDPLSPKNLPIPQVLARWEDEGLPGAYPKFPARLGIKSMAGRRNIWEFRWSRDGRATWSYGPPSQEGTCHIVWRRVGTHQIYDDP